MEAVCFSEAVLNCYHITRRHFPDDGIIQSDPYSPPSDD